MDQRLKAFINKRLPSALEQLRDWVGVNSHTRNAAGVEAHAKQVEAAFATLGFAAERVDAAREGCARHLFLSRPGTGPTHIALVSHLDTVFPAEEENANDFRWKVAGDRIYGPGTWDIKGGTLMALLLLEAMESLDPDAFASVNWHVALNSSEEILNHSFGAACLKRFPSDTVAALVFEGDGLGRGNGQSGLIRQRKGRAIYEVRVSGHGAHAGASHEKGVNAIRQLARLVEPLEQITDYQAGLTLNIGRIAGGIDFNRVPHEATLLLEMRAPDNATLDAGIAAIEEIVAKAVPLSSAEGASVAAIDINCLQRDPSWEANQGTQSLVDTWTVAAEEAGLSIIAGARGGLSDGNFLWHAMPTLDGLGPAGGNAHQSEWNDDGKRPEYVLPDSYAPKLQLNFQALLRLIESPPAADGPT